MPPELIIFDCDGVLIDSEGIAARLIAQNLTQHGWPMTALENQALFLGMSMTTMQPMVEAHLGHKMPEGWRDALAQDLIVALAAEAEPIAGAKQTLERLNAMGVPWRVASNSSDAEMTAKFSRVGMTQLVTGRTFASARWGRPKPAPDVFLAAAADAGVAPAHCLVIEDSVLGIKGAVAAGMLVYGFDPHGPGHLLLEAGAALVLHGLDELFLNLNKEAA
ncbi:MAG: HAD family phosphatase [Acidocella sp.]|nr:HAD family phosphatase [Acidocella sp.]